MKSFISFWIFTGHFFAFALTGNAITPLDSLRNELKKATDIKSIVNIYCNIAWEIQYQNPDSAIAYCRKAIKLSEENNLPEGIANAYNNTGFAYYIKGNFKEGLTYHFKALEIRKKLNNKKGVAASYGNIGVYYNYTGNPGKAIFYYKKALRVFYEMKDMKRVSAAITNIGNIFHETGNIPKALRYLLTSLRIDEKTGDKRNFATDLHNIGLLYDDLQDYSRSAEYFNNAFRIYRELNDFDGMAATTSNLGNAFLMQDNFDEAKKYYELSLDYLNQLGNNQKKASAFNNLAHIYCNKKDFAKAFEYCRKGMDIREEIGDKRGMIMSLNIMGNIYRETGEEKKALDCYDKSLSMAKEENYMKQMENSYQNLNHIYEKMYYRNKGKNDNALLEKAYSFYKLYISTRDSIINENKTKSIARLETKFEYEKKMAVQKTEYEKRQVIAREEARRKNIILISVILLLLTVSVFGYYIFTRYRLINYQKKLIEVQKKNLETANVEISEQKKLVDQKNKDITDSIEYGKLIQDAMFTSKEYLGKALGEYFLFFRPRDVVSGDFYWTYITPGPSPNGEGCKIILCCGDCTGHGVPGAFMSAICISLLDEVVVEKKVTNAGEILTQVRAGLLHRLGATRDDGMDCALCVWDKNSARGGSASGGKNTLEFAGANNSLYIAGENENCQLVEIAGDNMPVGYQEGKNDIPFASHTVSLSDFHTFYLSSDGYADQFGGEKNKKFKEKRLRELLQSIHNLPVNEQKHLLEKTFEEWKGLGEQTDDVTVIGIRI